MTSLPTRLATKAMAAPPTKGDDGYGSKAVVPWKYCNPYANYRWSPERPFQILGHTVVLAQRLDETIELHQNTGNVVWDGAYIMSRYIASHLSPFLPGTRCIELGSGSGLVGIAAWLAGAKVVVTELPGKQLEHLKMNVERNLARILKPFADGEGNSDSEPASSVPNALTQENITIYPLDWNDPPTVLQRLVSPPYDLVLGSEILYLPQLHKNLVRTLDALCHLPGSGRITTVLMVYKQRGLGEERFFEWTTRLGGGFEVEWFYWERGEYGEESVLDCGAVPRNEDHHQLIVLVDMRLGTARKPRS
ncbi:hypothetical protein BC937DRAFT_88965 [Endogone sp. FLAS-F59071]|nr:hypothetical protein BC937DRAFT_88965 [Endogone sp. FLAS-F59071]|eukprot:RUS18275.1 hypothetical protein BC937DRAFT_88965 [Endogone sp. FLAS-F59071]